MTTEPLAPEPPVTWEDHERGDRYEVIPPDAFDNYSDVDSTAVELDDDVDDPEDDS